MTRVSGVFLVMCPSGEPGTGGPLNRHNVRRMIREGAKVGRDGLIACRFPTSWRNRSRGRSPSRRWSITATLPSVYHAHYVNPQLDQQEREGALGRLLNFGYGAE